MIARDATMADVPALVRVKAPDTIHADRISDASEGDFRYLVCETATGEVVGHCCLVFRRPRTWPEEPRESLYPRLIDLMVREDRRGQGIGTAFLREIEAICADDRFARLYLSVDPEEDAAALRLYKRQGFIQLTEKPEWREWSFRDSEGRTHSGAGWDVEMYKPLDSRDERFSTPQMTTDRVLWFLSLFDELGLTVWLDGGWGVDSLLGQQTRPHADVDIILPKDDADCLVAALHERHFTDVVDEDRTQRNFVMSHPVRGVIDFHVVHRCPDGGVVYGPGEIDFRISAEELSAVGRVADRNTRCLTPEYQVRSHSGYGLGETDFSDMKALRDRFGVELLDQHLKGIDKEDEPQTE